MKIASISRSEESIVLKFAGMEPIILSKPDAFSLALIIEEIVEDIRDFPVDQKNLPEFTIGY